MDPTTRDPLSGFRPSALALVSPSEKAQEELLYLESELVKTDDYQYLKKIEGHIAQIFTDYQRFASNPIGMITRKVKEQLGNSTIPSSADITKTYQTVLLECKEQELETLCKDMTKAHVREQLHQLFQKSQTTLSEIGELKIVSSKSEMKHIAEINTRIKVTYENALSIVEFDEKVSKDMQQMQKQMKTGELPPSDAIVAKAYPTLNPQAGKMSAGDQQRVQATQNGTYLNNILKNTSHPIYKVNTFEVDVMRKLHFETLANHLNDPEKMHEAVNRAIAKIMQNPAILQSNHEEFKRELQLEVHRQQLLVAKIREQEFPYFVAIFDQVSLFRKTVFKGFRSAFHKAGEKLPKNEQANLNHPMFKGEIDRHLKKCVEAEKSSLIEGIEIPLLKMVKDKVEVGKFKENLDLMLKERIEILKTKGSAKFNELWEKPPSRSAIDWFKKHGSLVKVSFAQGSEDYNIALKEGVCLALCLRVSETMRNDPMCTDAILEADQIKPHDRFLQASHVTDRNRIPDNFLREKKLQVRAIFGLERENTNNRVLAKEMADSLKNSGAKDLSKSKGVVVLRFSNHAIALQLDREHNVYRLYDPNIGVLRADTEEEILNALYDLVELPIYKAAGWFDAFQLLNK